MAPAPTSTPTPAPAPAAAAGKRRRLGQNNQHFGPLHCSILAIYTFSLLFVELHCCGTPHPAAPLAAVPLEQHVGCGPSIVPFYLEPLPSGLNSPLSASLALSACWPNNMIINHDFVGGVCRTIANCWTCFPKKNPFWPSWRRRQSESSLNRIEEFVNWKLIKSKLGSFGAMYANIKINRNENWPRHIWRYF